MQVSIIGPYEHYSWCCLIDYYLKVSNSHSSLVCASGSLAHAQRTGHCRTYFIESKTIHTSPHARCWVLTSALSSAGSFVSTFLDRSLSYISLTRNLTLYRHFWMWLLLMEGVCPSEHLIISPLGLIPSHRQVRYVVISQSPVIYLFVFVWRLSHCVREFRSPHFLSVQRCMLLSHDLPFAGFSCLQPRSPCVTQIVGALSHSLYSLCV